MENEQRQKAANAKMRPLKVRLKNLGNLKFEETSKTQQETQGETKKQISRETLR